MLLLFFGSEIRERERDQLSVCVIIFDENFHKREKKKLKKIKKKQKKKNNTHARDQKETKERYKNTALDAVMRE